MRCNICDKSLSETEILTAPDGKYEPCSVCMEIIMDAAYSDGFVREESLDLELEDEYGPSEVETLDEDTFRTVFDHCDPGFQPVVTYD